MKKIIGLITLVFFWKFTESRVVAKEGDFFILPNPPRRAWMLPETKNRRQKIPLVTPIRSIVKYINGDNDPWVVDESEMPKLTNPEVTRFPMDLSEKFHSRGGIPPGNCSTHPYARFF